MPSGLWFVSLLSFVILILQPLSTRAAELDASLSVKNQSESVSVAFVSIDNLFSGNGGDLPYDRLWKQAKSNWTQPVKTFGYPAARAFQQFEKKQHDCIFPSGTPNVENQQQLIFSLPVNHTAIYLVSRIDSQHFDSVMDEGLDKIAVQRGYFTMDILRFKSPEQRVEVTNIEQQIGMLERKRVNAILVYEPDFSMTMSHHPLGELWYDKGKPLAIQKEQLVCWSSPKTREFIAKFDQWLIKVDLKSLLGRAKLDITELPEDKILD